MSDTLYRYYWRSLDGYTTHVRYHATPECMLAATLEGFTVPRTPINYGGKSEDHITRLCFRELPANEVDQAVSKTLCEICRQPLFPELL